MKEKAIKPDLQKMILSHKELNWRRSQGMNYESCCRDIPRLLQQELKNYLYLDMIKKVPLFKDADNNFLQSIALKIKVRGPTKTERGVCDDLLLGKK